MVAIGILEDRIGVLTDWTQKDMVKQIPGSSWDKDEKLWTVPLSWSACVQLRGIFGQELVMDESLRVWAKQEVNSRITPTMALRDLIEDPVPGNVSELWDSLYGFQKAGVAFLNESGSALLTDEMGTGKTVQALSTMRVMVEGKAPVLVICPNSMKGTWAREAAKWYPQATPYLVAGSATVRRKTLAAAAGDPSALVIIHFESVRLHARTAGFGSIALSRCAECGGGKNSQTTEAKCEAHPRELNKIQFSQVWVDEAHRIKDGQAKQTRSIWSVGHEKHVQQRFAMTGTPVANDASDLWAVMHFVNPVEYPTKSKFVDRYCNTYFNAFGGLEVGGLRPDTKPELMKFLHPRMRRMEKSTVLKQLPEKVFTTRYVEMTPTQKKAYREVEEGLVTRLEDGSLMVAKGHLVGKTRLIQFTSGNMKSDGQGGFVMTEPCPKLDVMEELLGEMGDKPLVVAAVHKQLIDLAEARLIKAGIPYGKITGDVPQWQRDVYVKDFQAGKLRVMLLTMQAGGVGITLTAADTMLRLQCSWSMVDNIQVVDRVHRIGSEKHQQVNIIDLVAADSVETDQVEKVQIKHKILKDVVGDDDEV